MIQKACTAFIIALFVNMSGAFAQNLPDSTSANSDSNATKERTFKQKADSFNVFMERVIQLFPVPIFSISKETGMLFGLTKFNDFNVGSKESTDSLAQPSTFTGLIYYTQKEQFKVNFETDIMFRENSKNVKGRITFLNFPLLFYGVGNETVKADAATVLYESFEFVGSYNHRIKPNFFGGITYKYLNDIKVEYTDTTESTPLVPDYDVSQNKGLRSGLGFQFTYEGRDNRLNPFKGAYMNAEFDFFEDWLGSDFNYNRLIVDLRKYIPLIDSNKLILATQVIGEFVTDGANIQALPALGGPDWGARGVYFGRFRDKSSLTANMELRFPLFWILGGTAFGGVGQVGPNLAAFDWNGNHYTYGGGLRLMVSSKNRVNLRLDMGFSEDDSAFILSFSEAF